MWKMITSQAIYQLVVAFTLYFAGPKIFSYDRRDATQMLELDTVIFNTFVWMQIFNEFSNHLDNRFNVFEGVHRNQFFILINCLVVGLQVAIVFIGSRAFEIKLRGLNGTQWEISLVCAVLCLPLAVVVRLFPDAWFAAMDGFIGTPFVAVYWFLPRFWSKFSDIFKRTPKKDVESNGDAPVVVVSKVLGGEGADVEKGRR